MQQSIFQTDTTGAAEGRQRYNASYLAYDDDIDDMPCDASPGRGATEFPPPPPPPPTTKSFRQRHNPYYYDLQSAFQSSGRRHNPYTTNSEQKFSSHVHPIFEADRGVLEMYCQRKYYSDYAKQLASYDHESSAAAGEGPWIRLLIKHFPLLFAESRAKLLASILLATLGSCIPISVEDPRWTGPGGIYYDSLVFMWVPHTLVQLVLDLNDRILCDKDSFLFEPFSSESDVEEAETLLAQYGEHVRLRLSQDQRHSLTQGLPSKPMRMEVSTHQRRW